MCAVATTIADMLLQIRLQGAETRPYCWDKHSICSQVALLTADQGVDLSKHIAVQTHVAHMWRQLSPVLDAYAMECGHNSSNIKVKAHALEQLKDVLAKKESSGADWRNLTASACAARQTGYSEPHRQLSTDAKLVRHQSG